MTAAVSKTAAKHGVLEEEAKAVEITFGKILNLFQQCHDTYSRAKPMTDIEIAHFSKYTKGVEYYNSISNSEMTTL